MRGLAGVTAVAAGFSILGVAPASAAEPAPTNVTVSWSSPEHTAIRVTWDEVGSQPNIVLAYTSAGEPTNCGSTTADQPNELDIPPFDCIDPVITAGGLAKLGVLTGTFGGNGNSLPGFSEVFDTLPPPVPVIDQVLAAPNDSVLVTWHGGAPLVDPNPGDPLDVPQLPVLHQVAANLVRENVWTNIGPLSADTQYVLERWGSPFHLAVRTSANEWGATLSAIAVVDTGRVLRAVFPARVAYSLPTVITGSIQRGTQRCDGLCWTEYGPDVGRSVVLQARADASSPWYAVGSTRTVASSWEASGFRFSVNAPGTRQYRVVVPNLSQGAAGLAVGYANSAATTTTTARLLSARFADPTVNYGAKATALLRIAPAVAIRTTLQRWTGSAWTSVKWVYLRDGAGSYTLTAVRRGTVAYRFVIPPFTYAGRPIAGLATAGFTLTTR